MNLAAPSEHDAGSKPVEASAWNELSRGLRGPLLRPGDEDFGRIAPPNNLHYAEVTPAGIARCANPADVRVALLWAQEHGVPLVARAGGHSYAGFSTTPGLLIDVSRMNEVSLAGERVTVGGGAFNRDVCRLLEPAGVTMTHGRCPSVGLAGLVLGGGMGFNMRRHGLTCDQLVETQLVTADGELLTCGETENADLFWACRGGGGGQFGIHTSFTFQTVPAEDVTVFSCRWTSRTDEVLAVLDKLLTEAPDELGVSFSLEAVRPGSPASTEPALQLLGQFFGRQAALRSLLDPLYALSSPDPARTYVQELPYWDAQHRLVDEGAPGYYQRRSRFARGPFDAPALATVLEWLRRWPGTSGGAFFSGFLTGGAVNRVASGATAFVHRRSHLICSTLFSWGAQDEPGLVRRSMDWLSGFDEALRPFLSPHSYQNFGDRSLPDWARAYYGDNLERLLQMKSRVDPRNVFQFPQSLGTQRPSSPR